MAEALPIPLWATISNNPWLREKYGFIRSVVPEVDKSSLCAELTLCETEEDVEAILQSLLLQHDSTFMAEPVASQLQQASSIDKRQEDQMQQDRVVVERPSVDMDEVEISEFPETCDNISVDATAGIGSQLDIEEVVLDSDEGSREEEAMALEATELGETAANAQALADYQSQEDAQLAANIAFIENLFPDAAPAFLQEKYDKCLEIQGLPEELAKFVDGLLKITKYPTNKDRIKEERKANRSSDLTSEWLYDDIGDEQVVAGVMLHCPICLEEKLEIDCCNALKNDHIYCVQCIESYVKAEMEQGRSTFKCMEDGCCAEFTMKVLRRVLDHSVLSRVLEQRQHEEILAAEIEDLESCPFCFFKVIVSNPSNKIFQCQNPDCLVDSCRLCKEESHIPLRCEEVEKDPQKEARKKLENKMSDAVIRECPQCKKRFIKEDGCNHITCSCGASICYYCKHLTNSPEHMNSNRCQQIVDANVIHRQDVHTAAMEGKQEMDPSITLVHDPTADIL